MPLDSTPEMCSSYGIRVNDCGIIVLNLLDLFLNHMTKKKRKVFVLPTSNEPRKIPESQGFSSNDVN